jgi:hypothetical protein
MSSTTFNFVLTNTTTTDEMQSHAYECISGIPYGPTEQTMEAVLCISMTYENVCASYWAATASNRRCGVLRVRDHKRRNIYLSFCVLVRPHSVEFETLWTIWCMKSRRSLSPADEDLNTVLCGEKGTDFFSLLTHLREFAFWITTRLMKFHFPLMPCQCMLIWCILITSKMEPQQNCSKTGFGLIPTTDVAHVKTFNKLFSAVHQVNRLLGASGNSNFLLTRRNTCCMMCDGTQSPSHTSRHRRVILHVSQVWWPSLSTFIHSFIYVFTSTSVSC